MTPLPTTLVHFCETEAQTCAQMLGMSFPVAWQPRHGKEIKRFLSRSKNAKIQRYHTILFSNMVDSMEVYFSFNVRAQHFYQERESCSIVFFCQTHFSHAFTAS